MKKLFLILVFVLSILSCNREDNFSIQEQLLGSWHLDNVSQRKDAAIINLQNGGASFEFSPSQLKISGNTILSSSGVFSYEVKNENYFNSDLNEQHFAKNLKPQSFQNQGIALFFLYFSQVRGLSRTLK